MAAGAQAQTLGPLRSSRGRRAEPRTGSEAMEGEGRQSRDPDTGLAAVTHGSFTTKLSCPGPPERAGVCEPHETCELAAHAARGPSRAQHPLPGRLLSTLTALCSSG